MRLFFGIGTGRCGTQSLYHLIKKQPNVKVFSELGAGGFEMVPWIPDMNKFNKTYEYLKNQPGEIVGEVAIYYLNYLDEIFKRHEDTRVICLKRDREQTARSFDRKTPNRNLWTRPDSKHFKVLPKQERWAPAYPKYDAPKLEALRLYWDEYYRRVEIYLKKYPNRLRMWSTEAFNEKEGQLQMLEFIGIPHSRAITEVGIRRNRT